MGPSQWTPRPTRQAGSVRALVFDSFGGPLEVREVPDVNHYTILMTSPGVEQVADAVRAATKES